MEHNSIWAAILLLAVLLLFSGVGVATVINPDYFIRHSGVRQGGELLTRWNRFQFRVVGLIFAITPLYMLFHSSCG
jgi:hypothetical protein